MRVALAAAVLAAAVLAAPAAATPLDRLTVTVWHDGRPGPSETWTLHCRPTGGTHPARASACRTLARLDAPFRPVPRDAVCTQIYGGPQEALVTGTFRGQRVWARFNLRGGCEIARWNRLSPLLPRGGAA
ncbi:MAG TPA: SSI family serine proteinase inhibitor [Gaiellaceae bacterium]|nr:SSI family serine proteinase inhibitor [Gaiellaceae bacterium]